MAGLKIFVSSTCYDLSVIRSQIRLFIQEFGHDPVMSEYDDVLYDYREHTHESCITEVESCDMMVLIIGSRFGGKAVPAALEVLNFEKLKQLSNGRELLNSNENLSITQLEILRGVELGIPIFTFVESGVWHDHALYEKNKSKKTVINRIEFPSIQKRETAVYIFEFINFLRLQLKGNGLFPFQRLQDIEETLRSQWASLFKRLITEDKNRTTATKKIEDLTEKFDDLKAAFLSTVKGPEATAVARAVVRFRRLVSFFSTIVADGVNYIAVGQPSWDDMLRHFEISIITPDLFGYVNISRRVTCFMVFKDDSYIEMRVPIEPFKAEWAAFVMLDNSTRQIVVDSITEMGSMPMIGPISSRQHSFTKFVSETMDRADSNGK
ncbi:DUF4062 domain-containing protein [Pseudomonas sp. NPDC088414]|uniref:DUF4062 domain-containing protein n=1 Tax=Pseudomonas sp. NPDC088414 TaxID=3364454 RepID=UPI0037F6CECE